MINQAAQVVFMDEWTNDSLCCEDAKRILQGKEMLFIGILLRSKASIIVIVVVIAYNNVI